MIIVFDYIDYTYLLACETITVPNTGTAEKPNNIKFLIIKNCVPFTDSISEMNNTPIDNAKGTGLVMPMYNFKKYNDNYSKI